MKRRAFLYTAAAFGAVLGITGIFYWKNRFMWEKQPLIFPLILSSFCDEETLAKIGTEYRKKFSDEDSREKLLNALHADAGLQTGSDTDSMTMVNDLELSVEKDFRDRNILVISGWVLSRTEARQCALLSLS